MFQISVQLFDRKQLPFEWKQQPPVGKQMLISLKQSLFRVKQIDFSLKQKLFRKSGGMKVSSGFQALSTFSASIDLYFNILYIVDDPYALTDGAPIQRALLAQECVTFLC